MGYILPIQHDTYTQYANRTVPVKQHYSYIQPATPIQLSTKYEQTKQNHQRFADVLEQKMKSDKYTSSFTGKGKLFNEYV